MLKALMVITMVSGGEYTAKLPSMEQCMKEVAPVESQIDVKSATCIPRTENRVPSEIFSQIMDTFMMLNERDPCGEYVPPYDGPALEDDIDRYQRSPSS